MEDRFGNSGVRVVPTPGGSLTVRVRRELPAKRLGRITGGGLFSDSQKLRCAVETHSKNNYDRGNSQWQQTRRKCLRGNQFAYFVNADFLHAADESSGHQVPEKNISDPEAEGDSECTYSHRVAKPNGTDQNECTITRRGRTDTGHCRTESQ